MRTCVLVADDGEIYAVLGRFTKYDHEKPKPDSRWDFFGIGGRFEGALPLKQPRQLRRFFGLLPAGRTTRVSVAKKSEIGYKLPTEYLNLLKKQNGGYIRYYMHRAANHEA